MNTKETSKRSLGIRIVDDLKREIKARTKAERKVIGEAINAVRDLWGHPHEHRGTGIRRLRKNVYECRVDLDERLAFVFVSTPPELAFFLLGTHDEVQKMLKTL